MFSLLCFLNDYSWDLSSTDCMSDAVICFISFDSQVTLWSSSPFYRWRDWGSQWLSKRSRSTCVIELGPRCCPSPYPVLQILLKPTLVQIVPTLYPNNSPYRLSLPQPEITDAQLSVSEAPSFADPLSGPDAEKERSEHHAEVGKLCFLKTTLCSPIPSAHILHTLHLQSPFHAEGTRAL